VPGVEPYLTDDIRTKIPAAFGCFFHARTLCCRLDPLSSIEEKLTGNGNDAENYEGAYSARAN
jgi:hypothetical protein